MQFFGAHTPTNVKTCIVKGDFSNLESAKDAIGGIDTTPYTFQK